MKNIDETKPNPVSTDRTVQGSVAISDEGFFMSTVNIEGPDDSVSADKKTRKI